MLAVAACTSSDDHACATTVVPNGLSYASPWWLAQDLALGAYGDGTLACFACGGMHRLPPGASKLVDVPLGIAGRVVDVAPAADPAYAYVQTDGGDLLYVASDGTIAWSSALDVAGIGISASSTPRGTTTWLVDR